MQVVACRIDGHKCLVNSVALALADIRRDTPDPEGGIIWRDGQGGTSSSSPLAIIIMIICGYSIRLDFRNLFMSALVVLHFIVPRGITAK